MKKQRSLPFGYEMRKGAIAIHSKEAQIVRRIYQLYEDGGSIITIARQMNEQPIHYSHAATEWNKHQIKRILENKKYIGDEGFPAILDSKTFIRIRELHAAKTAGWQKPSPDPKKVIWKRLECMECGGRILRIGGTPHTGFILQCKKCGKRQRIQPETFEQKLLERLQAAFEPAPPMPYAPTQEIMRMENEISRQIEEPSNAQTIRAMILEAAAKRYECCPTVYGSKPMQADWNSYKEAVEAALISDDEIQLRFKQDRKEKQP